MQTYDIHIVEVDSTNIGITSEDHGILLEMEEYFKFRVPNFQFHPKYKSRQWDGFIKLFNHRTKMIYRGLLGHVKRFAKARGYTMDIDPDLFTPEFSVEEIVDFLKTFKVYSGGKKIDPYDYQQQAVAKALLQKRILWESPTSSGKSLMIYLYSRFLLSHGKKRGIILVPSVFLVNQMYSDFEDYGWKNIEKNVHMIYSGQEKDTNHPTVISTWQSVHAMPARERRKFLEQFEFIVVDEAHGVKATAMKDILECMSECEYRVGATGSLDDTECHRLVIEGLTGPVHTTTTTKKLMTEKKVSELTINVVMVKYNDVPKNMDYHKETKFLHEHEGRNLVISRLCTAAKNNTLILTDKIEGHLVHIKKSLEENCPKALKVIHATDAEGSKGVKAKDREVIRKAMESAKDTNLLASYGTLSTGVSIKNLQNVIFGSSSKSLIRILQSIGRGLRKDGKENKVNLFDIVDDTKYAKDHFAERLKIYKKQGFKVKYMSPINADDILKSTLNV